MIKGWKWRLAIALAIVFLAGVATGLFAGARHARFSFIAHHSGHPGEHMRKNLERRLQLTPEQSTKIEPIINDTATRLETLRKQTSQEVGATFTRMHQEIIPFLTPEQKERLEALQREHQRMQRAHQPPPPDAP